MTNLFKKLFKKFKKGNNFQECKLHKILFDEFVLFNTYFAEKNSPQNFIFTDFLKMIVEFKTFRVYTKENF